MAVVTDFVAVRQQPFHPVRMLFGGMSRHEEGGRELVPAQQFEDARHPAHHAEAAFGQAGQAADEGRALAQQAGFGVHVEGQ
ncbi:hypothetical protein D9M71_802960 [compost metagenome]